MEGSVIAYQCGEGPGKGRRLETVCRDGNWELDPMELMTLCDENATDTSIGISTSKDGGSYSNTGTYYTTSQGRLACSSCLHLRNN